MPFALEAAPCSLCRLKAAWLRACGCSCSLCRTGPNGSSHAYLLERPGFRAAIITDALDIPLEVVRAWQLHRLDLLILGTSFVDESPLSPRSTRSVYDTREALALPWAQAAGRVILTHLSHDVDVRRVPLPQGWSFAQEGQGVDLA